MRNTGLVALSSCVSMLCLPLTLSGADARTANNTVLVEINGTKLTLSDLEQKESCGAFPGPQYLLRCGTEGDRGFY